MKKLFSDWTTFEKIWLAVFTLVNIYLFFAWGDSLLGFVSSITGMICVVLVAKGKISNYYFGIIQAGTYAYIAYTYGLYGEAMLNGLFYFPLQFVGIYMWRKSQISRQESALGEEVEVRRMTRKGWVDLTFVVVGSILLYAMFLSFLGGSSVVIDSATNVLSVTAMILMLKRYAEQWLFWIAVNVLSIVMWLTALISTGGNDISILVMWSAFLVNSVYGYVNWTKMHKKQLQ